MVRRGSEIPNGGGEGDVRRADPRLTQGSPPTPQNQSSMNQSRHDSQTEHSTVELLATQLPTNFHSYGRTLPLPLEKQLDVLPLEHHTLRAVCDGGGFYRRSY